MGLNTDILTDFGEKVGQDVTDFIVADGGESPSRTHQGSRSGKISTTGALRLQTGGSVVVAKTKSIVKWAKW